MESAKDLPPPEPLGVRCLEALGRKDLVGQEMTFVIRGESRTILAEDFLKACGPHATQAVEGFMGMDSNDSNYDAARSALQGMVAHYAGENNSSAE